MLSKGIANALRDETLIRDDTVVAVKNASNSSMLIIAVITVLIIAHIKAPIIENV
ncbi:hypothetical protein JCM19037_3035 [Geomicrobium sp. JCM 19037]|nr:hypothetical protein JCM19037_3035 [Geomicrobium sp. JCM 19037]